MMTRPNAIQKRMLQAAKKLSDEVDQLHFGEPVTHVYNPLAYAWRLHERYLRQITSETRVLFLGMNPGPWGMAQTGVPFGEVDAVVNWMKLEGDIDRPSDEHPKRLIQGLACPRSEVSGRRLWGLMRDRFGVPEDFFREHFVVNYCPLVFMETSGKNRTPDKLPAAEKEPLWECCDEHLAEVLGALPWTDLVGVGAFAEACLKRVLLKKKLAGDSVDEVQVHRILHPSPASPAANKDWSGKVTEQLCSAGVW